jgi:hypothetical protein
LFNAVYNIGMPHAEVFSDGAIFFIGHRTDGAARQTVGLVQAHKLASAQTVEAFFASAIVAGQWTGHEPDAWNEDDLYIAYCTGDVARERPGGESPGRSPDLVRIYEWIGRGKPTALYLAREALLLVEWAATVTNYQQEPACPACLAPERGRDSATAEAQSAESTLEPGTHFESCSVDVALSALGLRTKSERGAAYTMMAVARVARARTRRAS